MEKMLKHREDIVVRREEPDLLLLDPVSGQVKVLNETAAFVWDRCDGESTRAEVVGELIAGFENASSEMVTADLDRILEEFLQHDLMEKVGE